MFDKAEWNAVVITLSWVLISSAQTQNGQQDPAAQTDLAGQIVTGGSATPEIAPQLPMRNSTIKTLQGTVSAGVCAFTLGMGPEQKAVEAIARNHAHANADGTCEVDLEIGEPSQELLDWTSARHLQSRSMKSPSSPDTPETQTPMSTSTSTYTTSSGSLNVWYQDPVGIVVTEAQISLSWQWAAGLPMIWNGGTFSRSWFAPSGWIPYWNTWMSGSCGPTCAATSATAVFTNNVFPACLGGLVLAVLDPILVGLPNGTPSAGGGESISGPSCIDLLHLHMVLTKTK